jgi:outer membrane putative beta-barrel porin/alpha-amylase
MRSRRVLCAAVALAPLPLFAPPPLVTGDVPTADYQRFEFYPGVRYQEGEPGDPSWQIPFVEFVYGLTERQELTFETAYVSENHKHGLSDIVLGTKYQFVIESTNCPGIAGSFELKLPTASERKGLGDGEFDYDLRLRAQKTFGWFTPIANAGYTFLTDPEFGGVETTKDNVWFLSFAQEYQVTKNTTFLSEIYWVTREEPGEPNRLAANLGFKHKLFKDFTVHGSIGKSLRDANRGGPDLRAYFGFKYEFNAPWKH